MQQRKPVIEAAGGLLWRQDDDRPLLAVIHRQRYDDWSLPKGKRKPGESWLQTAVREVKEETNCRLRVRGFAGSVSYLVDGAPKVVLFWHMEMQGEGRFQGDNETDRLLWLPPQAALQRMSYEQEKKLLKSEFGRWPQPIENSNEA